eukprot:4643651-Pyramimonas_sp.AAC.1
MFKKTSVGAGDPPLAVPQAVSGRLQSRAGGGAHAREGHASLGRKAFRESGQVPRAARGEPACRRGGELNQTLVQSNSSSIKL